MIKRLIKALRVNTENLPAGAYHVSFDFRRHILMELDQQVIDGTNNLRIK